MGFLQNHKPDGFPGPSEQSQPLKLVLGNPKTPPILCSFCSFSFEPFEPLEPLAPFLCSATCNPFLAFTWAADARADSKRVSICALQSHAESRVSSTPGKEVRSDIWLHARLIPSILFNHRSFNSPVVFPGFPGFLERRIPEKNGEGTPRMIHRWSFKINSGAYKIKEHVGESRWQNSHMLV